MKQWVSIALMGLSFTCVASMASVPLPPAGVSCLTEYGTAPTPAPNANFCGCYSEQAESNCTALKEGAICGDSPASLSVQTCEQVSREQGITRFCTTEVGQLNAQGVTTVTISDCEQDVGSICGHSPSGTGECYSYWSGSK